jgi:hypothetical protein
MKQSKHLIQTIRNWYSSHNPSDDAKWCIQNLLGDYYGWGSEEQKEITEIMSPIDGKSECECEKTSSGWKMYSLNSDGQCIHCGRQISPKQEEIEPSNIDFKSKTDWQVHFIMLENKINEIINSHNQLQEAVNSLKGE